MDFEEALDDEHFDFRTGEPCIAGDDDWYVETTEHHDDWSVVR